MKRIGLLGGAFNPPHEGHLALARIAMARLGLDELRWVPSARSPHKPSGAPLGDARLRYLEAALAGSPFRIETCEMDRGGTSYTVDTLEELARREPDAAWILVMGADQGAGLPTWRRSERIWELASAAVAHRPGQDPPLPASLGARIVETWSGSPGQLVLLPGTGLELSSSALREALRGGQEAPGIPAQVLAAIRRENLYR